MRTIIAGSRTIVDYDTVATAIAESGFNITEVVSGGARGVDTVGELWAENNGIPVTRFLADWNKYGRAAGNRRNVQMAEYADALVCCWDGTSSGSADMISQARRYNLKTHVSRQADPVAPSIFDLVV